MIGLLVVTHEPLGQAYVQLLQHFFSHVPPNIRILEVAPYEDVEELLKRAQSLLLEVGGASGALMLSDIYGATPCNTACRLIHGSSALMLTGLNAPMMIKAAQYAKTASSVQTLAQQVKAAAIEGIMVLDVNAQDSANSAANPNANIGHEQRSCSC